MILRAPYGDEALDFDMAEGHVVSIALSFDELGPNCFYAPLPTARPVIAGDFVGDTLQGGAVNFKTITINPHGNGTHTECVGHIATEQIYIRDVLRTSIHLCQVMTVWPTRAGDDRIITIDSLTDVDPECKALLIRTMPNDDGKRHRQYSGSNPPYFDAKALTHLRDVGVQHLLTDLPSVDREEDGGKLAGHKAWWDYPAQVDRQRTITELVYVPSTLGDGVYMIDIQIADLALDASPSRIMLYHPLG
jgi:kynurenine formamidase